MRLYEFDGSDQGNTPENSLVTVLELIRNRFKGTDKTPTISTQALINLVRNTDKTFTLDNLIDANENDPAVSNIIQSFNEKTVTLNSAGAGEDIGDTVNPQNNQNSGGQFQQPVDTVDSMAKRAAKSRGASIS